MRCLIYVLFIFLILVIPSSALNNNNNSINASALINNASLINPPVYSNENIDNNIVNLNEENSFQNLTNLSTPENGIIESINTKTSQPLAINAMGIITIFLSILLFIIGIIIARYIENKKLEQFYSVRAYIKKLRPDDFKIKKYPDYIRKSSHDAIINRINVGEKKILVKGVIGLGKTRAVYEVIKELGLKTNYFVIIPTQKINLPILVPRDFFILKRRFILFFDDIDKYVSNGTEISGIINEFEKNSKELIVLATCREEEYDILKKERIHELFNIIEYDKLSNDDGIRLAKSVGKEFNPKEFDGTAGSIVLDDLRKKEYYNKFNSSEKNILRAIKLLSLSNILLPSEQLLMKVHKVVFHPNDNFNTYFNDLKEKKFIYSEKDTVFCPDYYLSKIVDDYPLGNQLFEHMLELRGVLNELRSYENLIYLGDTFSFKESYQDAIRCYDKVLEINPKKEDVWINKGIALAESGKYNEAIICYDKALEINPKNEKARYNKGIALNKSGKYNEAIKFFDKALEINPKKEDVWINKGIALAESGKYNEAITSYDKALEINPNFGEVHSNYANLLSKLKKKEEAEEHYRLAIEVNPKFAETHAAYGLFLINYDRREDAWREIELASNLFQEIGRITESHLSKAWFYEYYSQKNLESKKYHESSEDAYNAGENYIKAGETTEGNIKNAFELQGNELKAKSFVRRRYNNFPELIDNLKNATDYYQKASVCPVDEKQEICKSCYSVMSVFSQVLTAMGDIVKDKNPPIKKNEWISALKIPQEVYLKKELKKGINLVDTIKQLIICVDELADYEVRKSSVQEKRLKVCYENLIEVSSYVEGGLKNITDPAYDEIKKYAKKKGFPIFDENITSKTPAHFNNWLIKAIIAAVITIILGYITNWLFDLKVHDHLWDFINSTLLNQSLP